MTFKAKRDTVSQETARTCQRSLEGVNWLDKHVPLDIGLVKHEDSQPACRQEFVGVKEVSIQGVGRSDSVKMSEVIESMALLGNTPKKRQGEVGD